jgi:hypothetical protein
MGVNDSTSCLSTFYMSNDVLLERIMVRLLWLKMASCM